MSLSERNAYEIHAELLQRILDLEEALAELQGRVVLLEAVVDK